MSSNSFGNIFRITTWGESHGKAVGVVIDGCPAGLEISEEEIHHYLLLRAPGRNSHVTSRCEEDRPLLLSGVFEGKTTGTPISIMIFNRDVDSSKYEPLKDKLRPGHAHFTYLAKYGAFDYRGGGRSSARETACRVAAGAVAKKLLNYYGIQMIAFLSRVERIEVVIGDDHWEQLKTVTQQSSLFCPDREAEKLIIKKIEEARLVGDSLGGVVSFIVKGLPAGLGDPVYEKLEANLAKAMLSLPASKGFEIGKGFEASMMTGSQHNDSFIIKEQKVETTTNHAGGTLGGISTGMPLEGRVAFKPTSSIALPQETLNISGKKILLKLPEGSRHDPCVAIRAVPVVEAMCALVIADAFLMNRSVRL